jgi:hypothetical protein
MPPISLRTALLSVVSDFLWASSLKPCIRLVLKILWVGDEPAKGCKRPRDLGGAGCSRMLAAMLERHLTGNSKRRRRPEQRRSAHDQLPSSGTGFLVLGRSVLSMAAGRARKIRRRLVGQRKGTGLFSKRGIERSTQATYEGRPGPPFHVPRSLMRP